MKIRLPLVAIMLAAAFAPVAVAGPCQDDIAKIEKALESQELDTDKRSQADDMRSQAVQLCDAGNEDEGLAMTAEAKVLLSIE
jgi:hypothetical protein